MEGKGEIDLEVGTTIGDIGLHFKTLPPGPVTIEAVSEGTWARENGIEIDDCLLTLNGRDVTEMEPNDFHQIMTERPLIMKVGCIAPPCTGIADPLGRWGALVQYILHILWDKIVPPQHKAIAGSDQQPDLDQASLRKSNIFTTNTDASDCESISTQRSKSAPPVCPRLKLQVKDSGGDLASPEGDSPSPHEHSEQQEIEALMSACTDSTNLHVPNDQPHDHSSAAEDLKNFLHLQGRSISQAWCCFLDPCAAGRVTLSEFSEGCRRLGYRGNIRDLWNELGENSIGCITLADFDFPTAETLGRFHSALIMKYGNIDQASIKLGLTGPKKLGREEFCQLLRQKHLSSEREASILFKMLCTAPPDKAPPMITARELSWLGMIAAQLPALSPNSMELLSGGEERRNMGDDDDGGCDRTPLNDVRVFTKLYNDGLQHHRRREEISTPQVSQLSSHPANPETFERLHRDHEALLKKREDMTEVFFRRMIPQSNGKSDPERLKNLQQPRLAKAPSAPDLSSSDRPRQKSLGLPNRIKSLYEDHEARSKRQDQIRLEAALRKSSEEEAMLKHFKDRRSDPETFNRLYKSAADMRKKKEREIADDVARWKGNARVGKGPLRQETFTRLHDAAMQRQEKFKQAKEMSFLVQERELKESSIHKKAAGNNEVFERLHTKRSNNKLDGPPSPDNRPWSSCSAIDFQTPPRSPNTRTGGTGSGDIWNSPTGPKRALGHFESSPLSGRTKNSSRSLGIASSPSNAVRSDHDTKVSARQDSVEVQAGGGSSIDKASIEGGGSNIDKASLEDGVEGSVSSVKEKQLNTIITSMTCGNVRGGTKSESPCRHRRAAPEIMLDEVRNRILEQEWSKRPTNARSQLVSSLQKARRPGEISSKSTWLPVPFSGRSNG